MTFLYTDEQLNYMNRGNYVYSVNPKYVKNHQEDNQPPIRITENPNDDDGTNILRTPDNQQFQVIVTKVDPETGFDGMAVAPIVNGVPDYSSVVVIAAGTDPNNTHHRPLPGFVSADVASAIEARQGYLSPQYPVLDKFIQENPNVFLV